MVDKARQISSWVLEVFKDRSKHVLLQLYKSLKPSSDPESNTVALWGGGGSPLLTLPHRPTCCNNSGKIGKFYTIFNFLALTNKFYLILCNYLNLIVLAAFCDCAAALAAMAAKSG